MAMARPALLLAFALTLAPACGHKGPPLPPRRHTPPSLVDFKLAQRGDALELSCTAPSASVEGVAWEQVSIDFFWGEGLVDLEKAGGRRTVRTQPGARVVETVPLPAPGTLVRAAGRASAGRDRGQRSLIGPRGSAASRGPARARGATSPGRSGAHLARAAPGAGARARPEVDRRVGRPFGRPTVVTARELGGVRRRPRGPGR
jgi:hypothetical protein